MSGVLWLISACARWLIYWWHAAVAGEWVGIELDKPTGSHDGGAHGKRYFTCKSPTEPGALCAIEEVTLGIGYTGPANHGVYVQRQGVLPVNSWQVMRHPLRALRLLSSADVSVGGPGCSKPDPEYASRAEGSAGNRVQACVPHMEPDGDGG
eukprot:3365755-Rhodomonas_salina.2